MAETSNTTRRALLKGAPAAVAGVMTMPALAGAAQAPSERESLIALIEQLEAHQPWETSSVIWAKAFAAWQMRRAMGLDTPDPKRAQMHVDHQRHSFDGYQRTAAYERRRAAGDVCDLAPFERALA